MNRDEPNTRTMFEVCDNPSAVSRSLVEELREAEVGVRGGMGRLIWHERKGRFYDFIWLVYTVFFFIQPIQEHNREKWSLFAVAYLTFLGIYAGLVYQKSKRGQYLLLALMAALGAAYFPFNAGASGAALLMTVNQHRGVHGAR